MYRVAKELGIWNVEGPGGLIHQPGSWDQLRRWIAYELLEPFGEERADLRSGIISAAVTNGILSIAAGMAGRSDYKTVSALDFMPYYKQQQEEQGNTYTIEQQRAMWLAGKNALKKRLRERKRLAGKR